jgi:D-sedoheptulose 7-phosphate isomerase
MNWIDKINDINRLLNELVITDIHGDKINIDKGFSYLKDLLIDVRNENKTVYAIGNGASASLASHFAADLAKNGKLHTEVFSDLSLITAISNDLGYDEVFAEPLRRRGNTGDILVAISSSGNSKNILNAVNEARKFKIKIVTLSAMSGKNKLRNMGDYNLHIPATTYGNAESIHAILLHHWIDLIIATDFTGEY